MGLAWTLPHAADAEPEPFARSLDELMALSRATPARDGQPALVLLDSTRFQFDDQRRMSYIKQFVYRIENPAAPAAAGFSQAVAVWDASRQARPTITARVVGTDGSERWLDPQTLVESAAGGADPRAFLDLRLLRGPLPALQAGSIVEMQVVVNDIEPQFPGGTMGSIMLGAAGGAERTRVVVSVPDSMTLRHGTRLLPEARVTQTRRDNRIELLLEQGPLTIDPVSIVEAAGDQHMLPQFAFSTGESWAAVSTAYHALTEPFIRPDEVGDWLPLPLPVERDAIVARLLKLVRERVRYTGMLFGEGALTPRPPSVTLERRYGDCKDQAVLLASLLRAAGIPAQLALLNAGTGLDVDEALPGIGAFNHIIVLVPGEKPLWIDPTAEYFVVGELPFVIAGRRALPVTSGGAQLVQLPPPLPAHEQVVEELDIRLAEYGKADIRYTGRFVGGTAAWMRALAAQGGEAVKLEQEAFGLEHFDAERMEDWRVEDAATHFDVSATFAGSNWGTTKYLEARVKLPLQSFFEAMPAGLRAQPEVAEGGPRRHLDWVFQPQAKEWRLRVEASDGFQFRSLPASSELRLGPATFSQRWEEDGPSAFAGVLRFDPGRGRYTAEEGEAFRQAFTALPRGPSVEIGLDYEPAALLEAGDAVGAVRRHREMIATHAGKAIYRQRAAITFVELGLLPQARIEAQGAVELEPESPFAWSTLGWVLLHDDLGRSAGPGFDRDGALRAYRENLRLRPDDIDALSQVALVLESGDDGRSFGRGADIKGALDTYRDLTARRPGRQDFQRGLALSLWQAGLHDEVPVVAARIPDDSLIQSTALASRVLTAGPDAALRDAADAASATQRRERILLAARILMLDRHYEDARRLLHSAGLNPADLGREEWPMPVLARAQRLEDMPPPSLSAAGAAENFLRAVLGVQPLSEALRPWLASSPRVEGGQAGLLDMSVRLWSGRGGPMSIADWPKPELGRDLLLSNMRYTEVPIEDNLVRVDLTLDGWGGTSLYLAREQLGWRVLALTDLWHPLAGEALARIDSGDTAGARRLLEAAGVEMSAAGADGKVEGRLFGEALSSASGHEDAAALRLAVYALMLASHGDPPPARELVAASTVAQSDTQRLIWAKLAYGAAVRHNEPAAELTAASSIAALEPAIEDHFTYLYGAYLSNRRWTDAVELAKRRLDEDPGNASALQALAGALAGDGREDEALALQRARVELGGADDVLKNNLAWYSLLADDIDEMALSAARDAASREDSRSTARRHTLACLYAATGQAREAQRLILKMANDARFDSDPGNSTRLVQGLIAEGLGETDAAREHYLGMSPPRRVSAIDAYSVAMRRLHRLE